jgi:hypothetical protein
VEAPSVPAAADLMRRFFREMDGPQPESVLDWMSDELSFTVLFSIGGGSPVTEWIGGLPEWREYMANRPSENRPVHDLLIVADEGDTAVALGETRLGDDVVATFTATLRFDADGRIVRYFAGRSPGFRL